MSAQPKTPDLALIERGIERLYDRDFIGRTWLAEFAAEVSLLLDEAERLRPRAGAWDTFERLQESTGYVQVSADMENARGEGLIIDVVVGVDVEIRTCGPLPDALDEAWQVLAADPESGVPNA